MSLHINVLIFLKNFLTFIKLKFKERSGFLDQAEVAYKLQIEAQNAANNAIIQLEQLINEEKELVRIGGKIIYF